MEINNNLTAGIRDNLTPEEQQELAERITPRLAELCVKAFGPEVAPLFGPYLEDDVAEGRMSAHSLQQFMR